MPGQQLLALGVAFVLGKPGRQQQQRTKVIFWLILLHGKLDAVVPHPLT